MTSNPWATTPVFGVWCTVPDPFVAECLANSGFDFVTIDMQHGLIDYQAMVMMLIAIAGSPAIPVVRVPANDAAAIGRVLDAGARVVIVPMVESGAQAAAAVAACRYSPLGTRSYGPTRAARVAGTGDPVGLAERAVCVVMIETARGVAAAEEICATPGLGGIYIGPSDLAISLGVPLEQMMASGSHRDAVGAIVAAARRHSLFVGHHGLSGAHAKSLAAAGFDMVTAATDISVLVDGATAELAVAREATSP